MNFDLLGWVELEVNEDASASDRSRVSDRGERRARL